MLWCCAVTTSEGAYHIGAEEQPYPSPLASEQLLSAELEEDMVKCATPPRVEVQAATSSGSAQTLASTTMNEKVEVAQVETVEPTTGTSTKSIKFTMEGILEHEKAVEPAPDLATSGQWQSQGSSAFAGKFSASKPIMQHAASKAFSEATSVNTEWNPHKGLRREDSLETVQMVVSDLYTTVGKLGQGGFGTVWHVKKTSNEATQLACKSIPFKNVEDRARFELELSIARKLVHPHIIKLHQFFRDEKGYHLIMEMCSGGDLIDRLRFVHENALGPLPLESMGFNSETVGRYLWQMLSGLTYLHHYRFAHRDIKPENYLLLTRDDDAPIKLVDFGLARTFKKGEKMTSKVGTPHYVAPEVLEGDNGYDSKCDVWSVAAVAFTIALGRQPFSGVTEKDLFDNIINTDVDLSPTTWQSHSKELVDVIGTMMKKNPADRPTAKSLLSNPWLRRMSRYSEDCCCCFG